MPTVQAAALDAFLTIADDDTAVAIKCDFKSAVKYRIEFCDDLDRADWRGWSFGAIPNGGGSIKTGKLKEKPALFFRAVVAEE